MNRIVLGLAVIFFVGCDNDAVVGAQTSLRACVANGTGPDLGLQLARCTTGTSSSITLDFGPVREGTTLERRVLLENQGNAAVTVSEVALSQGSNGAYGISVASVPFRVQSAQRLSMQLSFTADPNRTTLGSVTIRSDDRVAPELTIEFNASIQSTGTGGGGGMTGGGGGMTGGGGAATGGGATGGGGGTTGGGGGGLPLGLGIAVVDAEFSRALDTMVLVANAPSNAVHLIDVVTRQDRTVMLNLPPTAVSVSPDGHRAVVGHDGWVTLIDLDTATSTGMHAVSCDVFDVVYGIGFVYAFPRRDQWVQIHSVNLATGMETVPTGLGIRETTRAKLQPGSTTMYGADNGLSPADIERYDLDTMGVANVAWDSPYHGDYDMCGNLWLSEDGARIFTACGATFRTSAVRAMDMTYAGSLQGFTSAIRALDHSAAAGEVVLIAGSFGFPSPHTGDDTQVRHFESSFLNATTTDMLPLFPGTSTRAHGHFVFWNALGTHYYVVMSGPGALDWAILER